MLKLKIRGIAAAVIAAAMLAGCSGGGSKSVLPSTPSSNANTVSTTLTVVIGGPGTQAATRNGQTIPVANSKSLVFRYVGDTNYLSPPTNPFAFPGTAPAASIGGNAFWNITGCTVIGAQETCTVPGVTLPIGTIDLYVLDYDAVGGTGNLIYGSVSTVTVTAAGAITNPGTGAPQALTALSGNAAASGATMAFANAPVSPLVPIAGGTLAAATPTNLPNAATGFSVSAKDVNGIPISGAIGPIVVTDADTSGNTCLLLVAGGGAAGTKTCTPVAGSTSSVTTTNTADSIYLQYNNAPLSVNGFKITAAPASGSSPAAISKTLLFTPTEFVGFANSVPVGGAIAAIGNTVFVNSPTGTTPPTSIFAYTFKSGALTLSATQPTTGTITFAGTTAVQAFAAGPDNNLWFADSYYTNVHAAIGVYAVTQATGPAGAITKGSTVETGDLTTVGGGLLSNNLNSIASYGGFIWGLTAGGDLIRVDPNNITSGSIVNGVVIVKGGTNNLSIPTGAATYNGGMVGVPGVGLFAPTSNGAIVKIATPSLLIGATSATLVAAGSVTETAALGAGTSGLFQASDGNVWTANATGAAGPFLFALPSTLAIGGTITIPTAVTEGAVAQGGPDNFIYTSSATAANAGALAWSSVGGGPNTGLVLDGAAGACTATAPGVGPQQGQNLVSLGGYILFAHQWNGASTAICVAVP